MPCTRPPSTPSTAAAPSRAMPPTARSPGSTPAWAWTGRSWRRPCRRPKPPASWRPPTSSCAAAAPKARPPWWSTASTGSWAAAWARCCRSLNGSSRSNARLDPAPTSPQIQFHTPETARMKTFRHAFLSLLLPLALVACGQQDDAASATPAASAPAASAQPAAQSADAAAPVEASADAAPGVPQGPPPVAGTHYVEIENGAPYQPLNGQVEVVEVFGYTCPACASFEPLIAAWKQRQPDDVRVT